MKYSVVIPIYNEEENILSLVNDLNKVLQNLAGQDYEIIAVDDGSSDNTLSILQKINLEISNLKIVSFAGRYGKSAAMQIGFQKALSELIITLDGDYQDIPSEIPKLINKINEGFDFVIGHRHPRNDSPIKKLISSIANSLLRKISGVHINDMGCNLRAFRRNICKKINLSEGLHRYFAIIAAIEGYKVAEVIVTHRRRAAGYSKYTNFGRFINTLTNIYNLVTQGKNYWRNPKNKIEVRLKK